jgi:hypothetical protein
VAVDNRDPHLMNIEPLRDAVSVNQQPGGAYVMRTSTAEEVPTRTAGAAPVSVSVTRGHLVQEVRQQFGNYASQIVRLREGSAAVELGTFTTVLYLSHPGHNAHVCHRYGFMQSGPLAPCLSTTTSARRSSQSSLPTCRPVRSLFLFF